MGCARRQVTVPRAQLFKYEIRQDGCATSFATDDDKAGRDRAHRIARKSLDTGTGAVEIMRQAGKGKPRVIAVLTQDEPVAIGERWG